MTDNVIISDNGPIRMVRMNRLEKMNAITDDMYDKLAGALESAQHDKDVRCVVITGGCVAGARVTSIGKLCCIPWPRTSVTCTVMG